MPDRGDKFSRPVKYTWVTSRGLKQKKLKRRLLVQSVIVQLSTNSRHLLQISREIFKSSQAIYKATRRSGVDCSDIQEKTNHPGFRAVGTMN